MSNCVCVASASPHPLLTRHELLPLGETKNSQPQSIIGDPIIVVMLIKDFRPFNHKTVESAPMLKNAGNYFGAMVRSFRFWIKPAPIDDFAALADFVSPSPLILPKPHFTVICAHERACNISTCLRMKLLPRCYVRRAHASFLFVLKTLRSIAMRLLENARGFRRRRCRRLVCAL